MPELGKCWARPLALPAVQRVPAGAHPEDLALL